MGSLKVRHQVAREGLAFLRPEKLGRHYHGAAQRISEAFAKQPRVLEDYFVRQYRIALECAGVTLHDQPPRAAEYHYQSSLGRLGFSADRQLLVDLLESYYGGAPLPESNPVAPTASEQRLGERLGLELLQLTGRLLLGDLGLGRVAPRLSPDQEPWEYTLELAIGNPANGNRGVLLIYLDAEVIDTIIRNLPREERGANVQAPPIAITALPVAINCVLVRLRMPLAQALTLKVDDVLPVRLAERCDVCINQRPLFTGSLAQHAGALVLKSLESANRP